MNSARDQQIRALYRAALEQPPAKRASFVAEVSGGDPDLKASIELLLSQDGATDPGARVTAASEPAAEIEAGTTFGQYRIEGVLGRGGIGVVYRAIDTKLHRPVAIKFLSAVVADADARRRFKQEAQTTSSLNHPHIVTVYDVGEHDGREYIVSELVDGGTLDDWAVKTRKRSWRQSVELLTGIADALAASHAAGVLHRDVKPGNILIGGNGYAKLADFGLAKLVDEGAGGSAQRPPNCLAANNTRAGVVVGTVAYMSPEQASGAAVDARSDVFSFGIVLYELVAGHRPFEAANDLELLKSIAYAAPASLPDGTPELLRVALDKALEKEPSDRYQTMQDLVADLKRVTRKGASGQAPLSSKKGKTAVPWLVAAALGVGLIIALVPTLRGLVKATPSAPPRMHFTIQAPGYGLGPRALAISPDGTRIAYAASIDGLRQIMVRSIGEIETRALPGTANAAGIFWSPDSRSLAFTAEDKLKRVDIGGGPPLTLADPSAAVPGGWARDGTILYTVPRNAASVSLGRVSASGKAPNLVTLGAPSSEPLQIAGQFLPDDKHFLYITTALSTGTLRAASIDAPNSVPILADLPPLPEASLNFVYADGYLLYIRDRTLLAQRFDADALALRGDAVRIATGVGEFSAANGVIVYSAAGTGRSVADASRHLVWVDRHGQRVGEVEAPEGYTLPALSPDGRRVAFTLPSSTGQKLGDIWIVDTQRGVPVRLTVDDANDLIPVWSPDGTRVMFTSGRNGVPLFGNSLYERAANGAGSDELLYQGAPDELLYPSDWSHDGDAILFLRRLQLTGTTKSDIWVLPTRGDKTPYPLLESPFVKSAARLSPDGRWIAYGTNESNGDQIVVRPFPGVKLGQWQVTVRGGYNPHWRADGRELYYVTGHGDLMAVDVQATGDTFETGAPHTLFSIGLTIAGLGNSDRFYDVTADGERFLISEPVSGGPPAADAPRAAEAPPPPEELLHVLVNWTSGLGTP